MVKYESAIKLPFTDWKKLLIGAVILFVGNFVLNVADVLNTFGDKSVSMAIATGVLTLIGIVPMLIAVMFVAGYAVRCAKSAVKGKNIMPEWNNWGEMFVKGLKASLISVFYTIPMVAFWLTAVAIMFFQTTVTVAGAIILLLTIPLVIILVYAMPMAIMRYIAEDRFFEAFNFKEVFRTAFTKKYLEAVFAVILYAIVAVILSFLLSLVTFITIIGPFAVSAVMQMAMQITATNIYAQAYREIKGESAESNKPATANVRIYKARKK